MLRNGTEEAVSGISFVSSSFEYINGVQSVKYGLLIELHMQLQVLCPVVHFVLNNTFLKKNYCKKFQHFAYHIFSKGEINQQNSINNLEIIIKELLTVLLSCYAK